jgi:hypothetical protein
MVGGMAPTGDEGCIRKCVATAECRRQAAHGFFRGTRSGSGAWATRSHRPNYREHRRRG